MLRALLRLSKPFTPDGRADWTPEALEDLRAAASLLLFGHLRGPQAGETP